MTRKPKLMNLCSHNYCNKERTSWLVGIVSALLSYLPSSLRLRGPYLSMTIPRGRVMAESRKEPTVNARFSISSCSLQISQPFIFRGPSIGTRGLISTPSPRPTTPASLSKYSA